MSCKHGFSGLPGDSGRSGASIEGVGKSNTDTVLVSLVLSDVQGAPRVVPSSPDIGPSFGGSGIHDRAGCFGICPAPSRTSAVASSSHSDSSICVSVGRTFGSIESSPSSSVISLGERESRAERLYQAKMTSQLDSSRACASRSFRNLQSEDVASFSGQKPVASAKSDTPRDQTSAAIVEYGTPYGEAVRTSGAVYAFEPRSRSLFIDKGVMFSSTDASLM
mmetsp:Transcript_46668/g.122562  ORF Transcript_46668/g.122562 Transcript_46668/m.122562 type:complete len:221 (-) Transcript_46668:614-1276(-)